MNKKTGATQTEKMCYLFGLWESGMKRRGHELSEDRNLNYSAFLAWGVTGYFGKVTI